MSSGMRPSGCVCAPPWSGFGPMPRTRPGGQGRGGGKVILPAEFVLPSATALLDANLMRSAASDGAPVAPDDALTLSGAGCAPGPENASAGFLGPNLLQCPPMFIGH